LIQI
jgi:hypothetical protein